jgi:Zn-dependent metalloprotease
MFYLLVNGGQLNGVTVPSIGLDKAIRIAIAANKQRWRDIKCLREARDGMIRAATDVYPGDASVALAVKKAWEAVKVNDSTQAIETSKLRAIINAVTTLFSTLLD